ncbi:MAG: hypothetical protein ETSY2_24040 [Candidatus Entotheonella gemina]|uniref:Yip1 domain-containing protein n=1 Tax=Candidatus Entotheonella gemina TaxID=1429439 RepID=W4M4H7_9BACT|nr:MAG: hypothetical protein ETSY2_24040 [Candidatus Entotheonella gemina]
MLWSIVLDVGVSIIGLIAGMQLILIILNFGSITISMVRFGSLVNTFEKLLLLGEDNVAIFFYTSLLNSIWLYFYVVSFLVVNFIYYLCLPLTAIKSVFDIDNHPILALGTVFCVFSTFLCIGLAPFILKWG